MTSTEQVGVECGKCGGAVYFETCDTMRGTGHEWALWSRCSSCDFKAGPFPCHDCKDGPPNDAC